jgi:hypothetical protein
MAQPPKGAPGATAPGTTVTVDRAALRALKNDLAQERATSRRLHQELTEEVAVARKAAEQTLLARGEREQYRRVLAAAVANEQRAGADVAQARADLERLELNLRETERARGEAEGRARELATQLEALRTAGERELGQVQDRAWADAEQRGRELQELSHSRGVALGQVRELLGRVPADAPESARVARLRARLCLGTAAFAVVLFLVFFAPFATAVFAGDSPTWPAMTAGLGAWTLFGLEMGLLLLALALSTWGLRDLRGVERSTREELEVSSERDARGKVDAQPTA